MTTKELNQQWVTLPQYSLYEVNRNGDVRIKKTKELVTPDLNDRLYTLRGDNSRMLQPLDRPWILFLAFGIEDLTLLHRCKDYSFIAKWHLYRHLRDTDCVLDKLLSDKYSPRWNEYFAEVKDYDDNLTDEGRFHASIDIYEEYADSWHRPLQAAKTCLNLGFATRKQLKEKCDLQELVELAFDWNNSDGGQYDVKGLTIEQAWDFMFTYCERPFKDSSALFWGFFCLGERWPQQGYPDLEQYARTQPFEFLEEWVKHLKAMNELEEYLDDGQFEDLSHFKYFTPDWNQRFKELVPEWEPWEEPYTWTTIPGFSCYEITDDEEAKPWHVRVKRSAAWQIPGDKPAFSPHQKFDYDQKDADGNPLHVYVLYSDDGVFESVTYKRIVELSFPNQVL